MTNFPVLLLSLCFLLSFSSSNPITSCNQTPYPQVCNSIIPKITTPNSDFRNELLQATLDRARHTYETALAVNAGMFNARAQAAWTDCMEFYQETIKLLDRAVSSSDMEDAQGFLSAASANQETCRNGFIDFGIPLDHKIWPFSDDIVSEAVCNALAVNDGAMAVASTPASTLFSSLEMNFPEWLSSADRRSLLSWSNMEKADLVVAKDGSGNFTTISDALKASLKLRRNNTSRLVIYVKAGVYNESVEVTDSMKNLMIIGDGIDKTVVTASKNAHDGWTTSTSATFGVEGEGFIAQGMTFENSAGPEKGQAVAFRSSSDHSLCYQCSFKGYQDTLYVKQYRQFYRECVIYGTVDFIFGNAAAVLQNCTILARKPLMTNQFNTVTAQGRNCPNDPWGIVIHNSVIDSAPDLKPIQGIPTFLGRPWREYSRTVVMKTELGSLIDPAGWSPWSNASYLNTLYYGEYMNTGPGAGTDKRVKWRGYHIINSTVEAEKFTVDKFVAGSSWIPATSVPFTPGL